MAFYDNKKRYLLLMSLLSEPEVVLFVLILVKREELADVVEINSVLVEQILRVSQGLEWTDS